MKNYIIAFILCIVICVSIKSFGQEQKIETRNIIENFEGPFLTFFEDYEWKMENGEFNFNGGDTAQYNMNRFTDDFYDFTLSTKCTWKGGNKNNAYGIFFREAEEGMYAFDITHSGYYRLQRLKDKEWKIITKWTKTSLIKDISNELKITCKGNSIKCFINKKKVIDVADNSFSHGDFGFGADGNIKCSYDDFRIGPPEEDKGEIESQIITDNFNDSSTIFSHDENWTLKNGEFHFLSVNEKYGSAYLHDNFSDFTVTAKTKWYGNKEEAGYGFSFREDDNGGYAFIINQAGQYMLLKITGTNAERIQPYTQTPYISRGYNELKVTCRGPEIDCFINNKKVLSIKDDTYPKGFFAFFADPNVECSFDDFSIGPPVEEKSGVKEDLFTEVVNENFDNGSTNFQLNSAWRIKNGALYHSSDEEDCMHWNRVTNSYNDCIISVKVKWDGSSEDSYFGIRYGDRHAFFITKEGRFKMSHWSSDSGWQNLVDYQETNLVTDDYNSLIVSCSGNNVQAFLNGTMLINGEDVTYKGGYVGVVCSCDVNAYFDDFTVNVPTSSINTAKNYNTNSVNTNNGNVLLSDSFDGSTSVLRLGERWQLNNGMLTFTNGIPRTTYWTFTNDSFNDFSCSVNAEWTGKDNNYGYGLAFGVSEGGRTMFEFDIKQTGYYSLSYWNGSQWKDIVAYLKTDLIKSGFNNLTVSCKGNHVLGYINNNQVINTIIDNYSGGRVGVFCCGEVDAAFDDFVIYKN